MANVVTATTAKGGMRTDGDTLIPSLCGGVLVGRQIILLGHCDGDMTPVRLFFLRVFLLLLSSAAA